MWILNLGPPQCHVTRVSIQTTLLKTRPLHVPWSLPPACPAACFWYHVPWYTLTADFNDPERQSNKVSTYHRRNFVAQPYSTRSPLVSTVDKDSLHRSTKGCWPNPYLGRKWRAIIVNRGVRMQWTVSRTIPWHRRKVSLILILLPTLITFMLFSVKTSAVKIHLL